jgi:hypothetical protein
VGTADEEVALSYERMEVKETDGREIVLKAPYLFQKDYNSNENHNITFRTKRDAEKAVEIIESKKIENRSEEDSEEGSVEKSFGGDSSQRIGSTESNDDTSTLSQSESESDSKAPKSEAVSCVHDYDENNVCQKCGWEGQDLRAIEESKSSGTDNKSEEPESTSKEKPPDQKDKKETQTLGIILELMSSGIKGVYLTLFTFFFVIFSVLFFWESEENNKTVAQGAVVISIIFLISFLVPAGETNEINREKSEITCSDLSGTYEGTYTNSDRDTNTDAKWIIYSNCRVEMYSNDWLSDSEYYFDDEAYIEKIRQENIEEGAIAEIEFRDEGMVPIVYPGFDIGVSEWYGEYTYRYNLSKKE